MKVLYLLLGWLFGLVSIQIAEMLKRYYQRNDLKDGIISEMKEIKVRLVSTVYLLTRKVGPFNKEELKWEKENLKDYEESYPPIKRILGGIEKILSQTDNRELESFQLLEYDKETGLSLKKFYLPFLESKIGLLPVLDDKFRNLTFEIRSRIQMLNEEIDDSKFYFRKSFDSSISPENHQIVDKNTKSCYKNIAKEARSVADKINKLLLS